MKRINIADYAIKTRFLNDKLLSYIDIDRNLILEFNKKDSS